MIDYFALPYSLDNRRPQDVNKVMMHGHRGEQKDQWLSTRLHSPMIWTQGLISRRFGRSTT